jgi:DNA-directed RNA polymerase subunit beta'
VYKPFTIRRLVQHGVPRLEAVRMFRDRTDLAKKALLTEMSERPVIVSRAPVLHRYGVMALKPVLKKGSVMSLPPLIMAGFGADADGDTMNFHCVASEEAKHEALEKMLPSKNLFSVADFKAHMLPKQEYAGGVYHASTAKDEKRRPVVFRNKQDMINAYKEGRISLDTKVEILQH